LNIRNGYSAGRNVALLTTWWAQQDSNLRPDDYESPALTN
jgi:hypothetical protein